MGQFSDVVEVPSGNSLSRSGAAATRGTQLGRMEEIGFEIILMKATIIIHFPNKDL